jgi:hypothetical protein
MGRTACTEPQCLYKGALYFTQEEFSEMSSACISLHVKYRHSCHISTKLVFLVFEEKNKGPNLMKICPAGTELFHVDGQTDMTKLIVAYRNFANAPKTCRRSFDMYMSKVPLISYDLGNLASCIVPYVTSHRGHCPLLIRVSCIT